MEYRDLHDLSGSIWVGDDFMMLCQVASHTFKFICLETGNRVADEYTFRHDDLIKFETTCKMHNLKKLDIKINSTFLMLYGSKNNES